MNARLIQKLQLDDIFFLFVPIKHYIKAQTSF